MNLKFLDFMRTDPEFPDFPAMNLKFPDFFQEWISNFSQERILKFPDFFPEWISKFQFFSGNESQISSFFQEWILNFQFFHSGRCQISRFYGNKHWISRNFMKINLKFPDFLETDPEFPDFFREWISNFQIFCSRR